MKSNKYALTHVIKSRYLIILTFVLLLPCITLLYANTPPVISNMTVSQRSDGTFLVDIYYDVYDADGDLLTISLEVSDDGGSTWDVDCVQISGDVGTGIIPGIGKHIVWDIGSEHPNVTNSYKFKVVANDGQGPANLVFVPGGTFTMGRTTGSGDLDELPTHTVTLNSFYIGKYEVTQVEYSQYMQPRYNWTNNYGLGDNYPAYYVSWYAILKYCNLRSMAEGLTPCYTISGSTNPADWGEVPTSSNSAWDDVTCNWSANGYRLPTEAEWEYAARGATNNPDYLYSGSDDINTVAWYGSNSGSTTHIIGTKAPNCIGTYDMSGNVWEWCWDWYSISYYSSSPQHNPRGPEHGRSRLLRGSSWYGNAALCRVASRFYDPPHEGSYSNVGFRLCRSIN